VRFLVGSSSRSGSLVEHDLLRAAHVSGSCLRGEWIEFRRSRPELPRGSGGPVQALAITHAYESSGARESPNVYRCRALTNLLDRNVIR
jgi:hypothetical protein